MSTSPARSSISPILLSTRRPWRWTAIIAASYSVRNRASRTVLPTRCERRLRTASTKRRWTGRTLSLPAWSSSGDSSPGIRRSVATAPRSPANQTTSLARSTASGPTTCSMVPSKCSIAMRKSPGRPRRPAASIVCPTSERAPRSLGASLTRMAIRNSRSMSLTVGTLSSSASSASCMATLSATYGLRSALVLLSVQSNALPVTRRRTSPTCSTMRPRFPWMVVFLPARKSEMMAAS
mmetsp:Transcript_21767/g.69514  ORF Transcript_21767/g.69514 Transcript_21767/m.69514 type:complete len:237 (+) Transcript_21767:1021-1731(+)